MSSAREGAWLALWKRIGARGDAGAVYRDLIARYAEAERSPTLRIVYTNSRAFRMPLSIGMRFDSRYGSTTPSTILTLTIMRNGARRLPRRPQGRRSSLRRLARRSRA